MRHLISPLDFSVEEVNQLLDLANDIENNPDLFLLQHDAFYDYLSFFHT